MNCFYIHMATEVMKATGTNEVQVNINSRSETMTLDEFERRVFDFAALKEENEALTEQLEGIFNRNCQLAEENAALKDASEAIYGFGCDPATGAVTMVRLNPPSLLEANTKADLQRAEDCNKVMKAELADLLKNARDGGVVVLNGQQQELHPGLHRVDLPDGTVAWMSQAELDEWKNNLKAGVNPGETWRDKPPLL